MADFSGMFKSVTSSVGGSVSKIGSSAFDLLDPSKARRAISGLLPGGLPGIGKLLTNIGFSPMGEAGAIEDDWRVRISLPDKSNIFYKNAVETGSPENSLMGPLIETNGVIFPYLPSITVSHLANYNPASLTHSNYAQQFYQNSEVSDISISGEFTVQNVAEGQYLMAAIYFFRSATKMFFGQGSNAGNPPPMVFLDGYGSHYFPHVPCVITNFTHVLPNDVDYLQIPVTTTSLEEVAVPEETGNFGSVQNAEYVPGLLQSETQKLPSLTGGTQTTKMQFTNLTSYSRVPTQSTITITVRPVYSRKNLHENFDLDKFAAGKLLQNKDLGTGGFL